jgi:hypothetical protein
MMKYDTTNRNVLHLQALKLCTEFCELNQIPMPTVQQKKAVRVKGKRNVTAGYYSPHRLVIQVYVELCNPPSRSPYAWTWPGYTADLTVLGVLAHELGHHWHWTRPESQTMHPFTLCMTSTWKPLAVMYSKEVKPYEKPVTSYGATNSSEGIAEAFKVFVTNPTLLLALHPFHYAFFMRRGLQPAVTSHWSEILSESQRHLDVVQRKLDSRREWAY